MNFYSTNKIVKAREIKDKSSHSLLIRLFRRNADSLLFLSQLIIVTHTGVNQIKSLCHSIISRFAKQRELIQRFRTSISFNLKYNNDVIKLCNFLIMIKL